MYNYVFVFMLNLYPNFLFFLLYIVCFIFIFNTLFCRMFLLLVADATYGSGCIIDVINSNDLFTQTQLQGITKHHCSLDDLKCPSPQAYSVYDEEIGYCQGQSFLAAVLLLHVSRRVVFPLSEDVYSIFFLFFFTFYAHNRFFSAHKCSE